jgi:site-specific recombinase XerD
MSRDPWRMLAEHWGNHLEGVRGLKPTTVAIYAQGVENLAEWAGAQGIESPADLTRRDLTSYFADFRKRKNKSTGKPISDAYVRRDYASLRQFCKWLHSERETKTDLMLDFGMPKVTPKRIEVFTDAELAALLDAADAPPPAYVAAPNTSGPDFVARRDVALLRILIDCGLRRAELMGLAVDDVDLKSRTLIVTGKGGERRRVPIGVETREEIGRYLRARDRHKDADLDALWLAASPHRGAMGIDGLRLMLNRRSIDSGVPNVHPHRFRHTCYNAYTANGLDGTMAMTLFGWSTRSMLDHYAKSNAEHRAIETAHRLTTPGDRLRRKR